MLPRRVPVSAGLLTLVLVSGTVHLAAQSVADQQALSAAQQFGQEDDITVLTLTFAPVEALHA